VSGFYWERHPDRPFATLIAVAATYCAPEAYDDLISRAQAPEPDDEEIGAFIVPAVRRRTATQNAGPKAQSDAAEPAPRPGRAARGRG
jgi:hypothetical protein